MLVNRQAAYEKFLEDAGHWLSPWAKETEEGQKYVKEIFDKSFDDYVNSMEQIERAMELHRASNPVKLPLWKALIQMGRRIVHF